MSTDANAAPMSPASDPNDPAAAEAYVASHLATREDWQLASTLASNIFGEDPDRAKEWVRQLPNEDARRQADVGLAIQWGFSDPAAATKWAATLPPGEGQQTLAAEQKRHPVA